MRNPTVKAASAMLSVYLFLTLFVTCTARSSSAWSGLMSFLDTQEKRAYETSLQFNAIGKSSPGRWNRAIRSVPSYEISDNPAATASRLRVKRQATGGGVSASGSVDCGFVPVNSASLVESLYGHFSKESSTNILEYDVSLVLSSGEEVDLNQYSSEDAYKPFRWFRSQGEGSSDLLQVKHYYFGLISPFMDLGQSKAKLTLNVTSPACLNGIERGRLGVLIMNYLLRDFDINPSAVVPPYIPADKVEVCHMTIRDDDGWGKLTYKCCGFESEILQCRDVYEDAWVWVLRAFVMVLTILLFLYFPALLPRGYRIYDYAYYPPGGLQFNFRITHKPYSYSKQPGTQVLKPKHIKGMTNFRSSLANLQPDVTYTTCVRRLDVNVCADRLLQEDCPAISITRGLFDTFIRCKIRHADPLEDCCKTNACGKYCLRGCPPWQAWMRAVRTVLVMAVLALPALPFMYAQAASGLEYQELNSAIRSRDLQRPFNFYAGKVFSKVIVGVLAFMYILHIIVVVIDGATDGNIGKLYTDVLDVSEKKGTIRRRMEKTQSFVKRAFIPIQRCGILIVPIWALAVVAIPLYLVIDFFLKAPMFKVAFEGFKRLLRYSHLLRRKPVDETKTFCGLVEIYLFFFTIVFVFIVLGIGANFLVHVVAMVIVKVLVDARLVYRVLPAALLLLLYFRDSFNRVSQRYSDFLNQIMASMRAREADDLKRECFKQFDQQMNKIFKILPHEMEADPDDEVVEVKQKDNKNSDDGKKKKQKNLFLLKNGGVRMYLDQLLLFLDKDDFLFTSKKFLFDCCTMHCVGAPGFLEDNYIMAVLDFLKIGVFLVFVFLVVMAYGNAYYISPTNQMFVTLVSGLLPLLLRNVFLKRGAVETVKEDFRFEARLEEKIAGFSQTWDVHDIVPRSVEKTTPGVKNMSETSAAHVTPGSTSGVKGTNSAPSIIPKGIPGEKSGGGKGGDKISNGGDGKVGLDASVIHVVIDLSKDPYFLQSPPTKQPEAPTDPYSLPDCESKPVEAGNGCCGGWRSRVGKLVSCSCCKGDNTVAVEKEEEKNWSAGRYGNAKEILRKGSGANFFWDPEEEHINSGKRSRSKGGRNRTIVKDKPYGQGERGHPSGIRGADGINRAYANEGAELDRGVDRLGYMNDGAELDRGVDRGYTNDGVELDQDVDRPGYTNDGAELDRDVDRPGYMNDGVEPDEYRGRNFGRWKRQSEARRQALMQARQEEANAHANNVNSTIDAYLVSNAVMSTLAAADDGATRGGNPASEGYEPGMTESTEA